MTETADPAAWWESLERGRLVELGFVKIDRVGSSGDFELPAEIAIQRRAEFHILVEGVAKSFDALQPLSWQGDGVMLFVSEHGSRRSWSRDVPTTAAMKAGLLGLELLELLARSGFDARLAAHCGRVAFERESGSLASPEIDRCGHLEHDTPSKSLAVTDDVLRALPKRERDSFVLLGTTFRDRTTAHVYPKAAQARRDASKFDSSAEKFEKHRAQFLRILDDPQVRRLRYVGLRLTRKEPPSLDLFQVFTPLEVEERRLPRSPEKRPESATRHDSEYAPWQIDRETLTHRPFREVFAERRHIVVLGDPGSGKTTLLRWLALTAADGRAACRSRLGADERLFPVLVSIGRLFEIREAMLREQGAAAPSFLTAIVQYFRTSETGLTVEAIESVFEQELKSGNCLLLLDGIDEVPTDRRGEMSNWIERFAANHRENRFVVTSRIFGFTGIDLPQRNEFIVQPFDDEQVKLYLRGWFSAYRAWESNLDGDAIERDRPNAKREADGLAGALSREPRLALLSRSPFMLSALALVHRAEGQLPSHRIRVYEIMARALCETWSQARQLVANAQPNSSRVDFDTEAIPVLGRLAYWLHENHGAGAAPRAEVEAQVSKALQQTSGIESGVADESARVFLHKAQDELQLLVERGPGLLGFLHLTFQEYFAAAHLNATDELLPFVRKHWFDARWEEVILLGVGSLAILQGRVVAAEKVIETLLNESGGRHPWLVTRLHKNVILAARCCLDAPNVGAKTVDAVVCQLVPWLLEENIEALRESASRVLGRSSGTRLAERILEKLAETRKWESVSQRLSALAVLSALADLRALEPLLAALRDPEAHVRWSAARALGQLGAPTALEPLLAALRDPEAHVRWSAAWALGRLGAPAALEPLLATLRDPEARVRWSAAWALSRLGAPTALEPLLAALRGPETRVRSNAAQALGQMGAPAALEPLLVALRDPEAHVRSSAAEALGQLGAPAALEPLLAALRDPEVRVRWSAAEALGQLGAPAALEPLLAALRDPETGVRSSAAQALGQLGAPAALEPLLAALRDPETHVRSSAARALGQLGAPAALEPLLAALRDPETDVRSSAAEALGQLGAPAALEPLLGALRDPETGVRWSAAEALGQLGAPAALEPLLGALRDPETHVRWSAAEALGQLGAPAALEPLLAALRDPEAHVRSSAAEALGQLGAPAALASLLKNLDVEKSDGVLEAAARSILVLAARIRSPDDSKAVTSSATSKTKEGKRKASSRPKKPKGR